VISKTVLALLVGGLIVCDALAAHSQERAPGAPAMPVANRSPGAAAPKPTGGRRGPRFSSRQLTRRLAAGKRLRTGSALALDTLIVEGLNESDAIASGRLACRAGVLSLRGDKVFLGKLPKVLVLKTVAPCDEVPVRRAGYRLFLLRRDYSSDGSFFRVGQSVRIGDRHNKTAMVHLAALRALDSVAPRRAAPVLVRWLRTKDRNLSESALRWLHRNRWRNQKAMWDAVGAEVLRFIGDPKTSGRGKLVALNLVGAYGSYDPAAKSYEAAIQVLAELVSNGSEGVARAAVKRLAQVRFEVEGKPYRIDGTSLDDPPLKTEATMQHVRRTWAQWVRSGGHRVVDNGLPAEPDVGRSVVLAQRDRYSQCLVHLPAGAFRGNLMYVRIEPSGEVVRAEARHPGGPERAAYVSCMQLAALKLRFAPSRKGFRRALIRMSHEEAGGKVTRPGGSGDGSVGRPHSFGPRQSDPQYQVEGH